jgi:hypothetical protein
MYYKQFLAALTCVLLAGNALVYSQDNWGAYKPRTIGEVIKQHSNPQFLAHGDGSVHFSGDSFPSRVKVTYTGSSRDISARRKKHISAWVKTNGRNPEIANLFETELLFKEGDAEYWLPVQKQVIPYFAEELKKGDQVTVFTIWVGAYKEASKWDWVFLVNEFEK